MRLILRVNIQYSVFGIQLTPRLNIVFWILISVFFLTACTATPVTTTERSPISIQISADGENESLTTAATTVRGALEQADITLNDLDEVVPPLFTPLEDGLNITVTRIREELVAVPESIPFARKFVRNDSMASDDPPLIIQAGKAGLQEETTRIVYRDGLESERWVTQVTILEESVDEIVMIGIGAGQANLSFAGQLAYLSSGSALILRGSSAFPEQLNTGSGLDGRIFSLSPTGSHLLYSRVISDTAGFSNTLWLIGTERNAEPTPLNVSNVLWADWNPSRTTSLQIAYSTADTISQAPGWEANNDLWLLDIDPEAEEQAEPIRLMESYPALYGWWGGNYAWSPNGSEIGFSYANEVGTVSTTLLDEDEDAPRAILQAFTQYDTLRDWVWVPSLTWSPNGRFLAFTNHGGAESTELLFNSWVINAQTAVSGQLLDNSGIWAHLHWSPTLDGSIAYLQATDPLDSLRSSYTLWLMDSDGSNSRQIYPPAGENSRFPADANFMTWGPTGQDIAFIFDDALHIYNLPSDQAFPVTQDDAIDSNPTWAPYGAGLSDNLSETKIEDGALLQPTPPPFRLPSE